MASLRSGCILTSAGAVSSVTYGDWASTDITHGVVEKNKKQQKRYTYTYMYNTTNTYGLTDNTPRQTGGRAGGGSLFKCGAEGSGCGYECVSYMVTPMRRRCHGSDKNCLCGATLRRVGKANMAARVHKTTPYYTHQLASTTFVEYMQLPGTVWRCSHYIEQTRF